MDDAEAYEHYADPAHRELKGVPVKRRGQRLTSMSSVRFAPEVIEAVKNRAFEEGITVGSWLRRLVQREIEPPAYTEVHVDGLDTPLRIRAESFRDVLGAMAFEVAAHGPIDLRVGLASAAMSQDGVRLTTAISITAELADWRASERERREAARAGTADVTGGREVPPRRIPSSPQSGPARGYGYAIEMTPGKGRTFSCPHFSVGNAVSAACEQCGPLEAAA